MQEEHNLQAKKHLEATMCWERDLEQILSHSPWKEPTLPTGLMLDFKPPELWYNQFLLFKPPNVWYFVMAALAS